MKELQDRGFTYSMDARWGATSRDCSSAVCESRGIDIEHVAGIKIVKL